MLKFLIKQININKKTVKKNFKIIYFYNNIY